MKRMIALLLCGIIAVSLIGCSTTETTMNTGEQSVGELEGELFESPGIEDEKQEIVYWVPGGEVWHTTPQCFFLRRSNNIRSGTKAASGKARACKICG